MEVLQQYGQNTDDMSITICNTTLEILSEYADWIDVSFMNMTNMQRMCFCVLKN